eukprot:1322487-Prymnesium_polylepis.1
MCVTSATATAGLDSVCATSRDAFTARALIDGRAAGGFWLTGANAERSARRRFGGFKRQVGGR